MSISWTQANPGIVDADGFCFRYTDKCDTNNEQYLFSNWWREQIDTYGSKITYFVNQFNVLSADPIYGEQPNKIFAPGVQFVAAVQLSENADMLSKFGYASDDAVTLYMHISSFYDAFEGVGAQLLTDELPLSVIDTEDLFDLRTEEQDTYDTQFNQIQPKAGDVFALSEYALGRPGGRGAKQFEVTEIQDEDIATTNQLGGHYVWIVKAKRYDYSFEPGLSAVYQANGINLQNRSDQQQLTKIIKENYPNFAAIITLIQTFSAAWSNSPGVSSCYVNVVSASTVAQVFDNSFSGLLSGSVDEDDNQNGPSPAKKYPENIDLVSATVVLNMSAVDSPEIYGGYY